MINMETVARKDLVLCEIIDKYSEWIEMTDEPEYFLIEILTSLLIKAEDENKILKKLLKKQHTISKE